MMRSVNDINVGTTYQLVGENAHTAFPLINKKPTNIKMSQSLRIITTSIWDVPPKNDRKLIKFIFIQFSSFPTIRFVNFLQTSKPVDRT